MSTDRVFLVAGDGSGWAIDEDRKLTRRSLESLPDSVTVVDRHEDATVIHAVWWEPLMDLPAEAVTGKRVVCHFEEDPRLRLGMPAFAGAMQRVDHWIVQSRAAHRFVRRLGLPCSFVPYAVDAERFGTAVGVPGNTVARALSAVPQGSYVVANFHRDTLGEELAEGRILPKHKKGPDLFAEVLGLCRRRGLPVVALLAGPRRHWLRARLDALGVPCVFAGNVVSGDDYPSNILSAADLVHLYRAADLHLSCSRHEGGPRGVLEAAAAGVPQLSTDVGLAADVLPDECLFSDAVHAAELIARDIESGLLRRWAPVAQAVVSAQHSASANVPRWRRAYDEIRDAGNRTRREVAAVLSVRERPRRLSFWNEFRPPPWGGGNQFMLALKAECERQGIEVTTNGQGEPATAHLLNSCWFDVEGFERTMQEQRGLSPRVVHRIDGPINLYRRTPDSLELDELCFDLNRRHAHATVVQSAFTLGALAEGGFMPVRPVIVHNAVDPAVFVAGDSPAPAPGEGERLRVIASSWSDNPGKGAAVYSWLDRHADHDRFEFTFVGRIRAQLRNWTCVEAQPSDALAELLRGQHVYLTASRDDPCSNALIEAQSCGLPAVYLRSGGHPEVVQFGGLGFMTPMEIPGILERMRSHLDLYRAQLSPPTMADVAQRYLRLMLGDAAYES